ncbi:MAG: hypothetical protein JWQ53_1378, partial [Klenkia sp.]|nr:hypothetical protein [Klenkia sp.]
MVGTTGQVGSLHRTVFHVNREVARALADAFLGAPAWRVSVLVGQGRAVLSTEPSWLGRAAVAAVTSWPEPPRDAPGELARFLLRIDVGTDPDDEAPPEPPPRVVRRVPNPTRMGRTRWPVHPLHDLTDVAQLLGTDLEHLDWYADRQGRQRAEPAGHLQLYRRRWLPRPGRAPRLLEVPTPRLRADVVLPLDLAAFFATVTSGRV